MSLFNSGVDLYALYTIVRRLATPFNQWRAFKVGLIDADGNFLVKKEKRTPEQESSLTYLDIFIMNLKKLLQKVPGANNKLVTYAGALWLLRECDERNINFILYEEDGGAPPFANTSTNNIARSSEKEAKAFRTAKTVIKRRKQLPLV